MRLSPVTVCCHDKPDHNFVVYDALVTLMQRPSSSRIGRTHLIHVSADKLLSGQAPYPMPPRPGSNRLLRPVWPLLTDQCHGETTRQRPGSSWVHAFIACLPASRNSKLAVLRMFQEKAYRCISSTESQLVQLAKLAHICAAADICTAAMELLPWYCHLELLNYWKQCILTQT